MLPKIIHQIGNNQPPAFISRCLQSWSAVDEIGFERVFWTDEDILSFLASEYPHVLQMFKAARNHAEAADIARYTIVYHFGGHYIDWDVELLDLNEFESLCKHNPNGFLLQDRVNQTLASEVFSASRKEKYLMDIILNMINIYENNFRDCLSTPQFSGPYRMRETYYFRPNVSKQQLLDVKDVFLYDYAEIREMAPKKIKRAMVHYWMHSWF